MFPGISIRNSSPNNLMHIQKEIRASVTPPKGSPGILG
jgi:hypothetical protein